MNEEIYILYFIMYTYTSLFTVHHIDLQPKGSIYSFLFGKTRCLFMFSKFKTRLDQRMDPKISWLVGG